MSFMSELNFEAKSISLDHIKKLSFQVGTIIDVKCLVKARKPSYEMDALFEVNKKSCGQFTRNYKIEELIGKQIIGLTNLPFLRIAGIKSEYLTLGFPDELNDGQAIPLTPCLTVTNGEQILLPDVKTGPNFVQTSMADYKDFESVEILSATVVDIITTTKSGNNFCVVDFGEQKIGFALVIGKLKGDLNSYFGIQIPVICNLDFQQDQDYMLNKKLKLIAFTLPLDSNYSTLVKVDKPVKNGLKLF